MKVLLDGLSVSNFSGQRVFLGHWQQAVEHADQQANQHRDAKASPVVHVVCRPALRAAAQKASSVASHATVWHIAPNNTDQWWQRRRWGKRHLPVLCQAHDIRLVWFFDGMLQQSQGCKHMTLAQNPWAFESSVHTGSPAKLKAALQRHAYRVAQQQADFIGYVSDYIRDAYRQVGGVEQAGGLTPNALPDWLHQQAQHYADQPVPRVTDILCVSAMLPHKRAEDLVEVVRILHQAHTCPANLMFVGPWSDAAYEQKIRRLVAAYDLEAAVTFAGAVSDEALVQAYAEAKVFALLSHCESFGLPALEAQRFGTPVVTTRAGGVPQVCGEGARYCAPGDTTQAAAEILQLLTDDSLWQRLSNLAVANAKHYTWSRASQAFLDYWDSVSAQ